MERVVDELVREHPDVVPYHVHSVRLRTNLFLTNNRLGRNTEARRDYAACLAAAEALIALGAVGDVCLRYFDATGASVTSPVDDRLIGMTAREIRAVPRRMAVAGGQAKAVAIRAALLGGWVSVLITDEEVAESLISP